MPTSPNEIQLLREVEDVALELDKAINVGDIDHVTYARLKKRYDEACQLLSDAASLEADNGDNRYYIIDEAAGLFAWIDQEKDIASHKIAVAIARKGDVALTSQAARNLDASAKPRHDSSSADKTISAYRGWLGFFYATIMIVLAVSLLISVLMTVGAVLSLDFRGSVSAYSVLLLFYAYAGLSVFYVRSVAVRSQRAIPAAIVLFGLLSAGCIALIIGSAVAGNSSELPTVYYVILWFLVLCGISTAIYYALSRRVRRVFNQ